MISKKKFKRLWGLSLSIAEAEFKLRNEGSYLGILWYLLEPLLMFILLLFVFSKSLGQDIPHYPLYLLVGIIVFNFFQKVTL
ncbi:MAG: ABC transporter permease, partial [Candidatus Altiarchaeales archaeon]|nr:ABC transporter permease [Candidatus Altiarchaeales archaeon]